MAADFILTLRMQKKGGQQLTKVHEELKPSGVGEWIIFIHGFRVSQAKAMHHWRELRKYLPVDDSGSRVQCGIFLWPSDQSNIYPKMIPQAATAGRKLAAYLREHPASKTVLIGHSMGARVALQAADSLAGTSVELRGLVLLGAAVRTLDCEEYELYERAHARREAVGFSVADKELSKWFRRGERAAAPWQEIGEAVGHRGGPESRDWKRWDSKSDDHSYWKFENSGNLAIWALDSSGTIPAPAALSPAETSPNERSPRCTP